jgi:poly(3-hydroxybutyrate) depolymerase
MRKIIPLLSLCISIIILTPYPTHAENGLLKGMLAKKLLKKDTASSSEESKQGLYVNGTGTSTLRKIGERSFILYSPASLPINKPLPLLIVLHGGMGNGKQIQKYIGLEPYADRYGFLIAYMNGTAVTKILSSERAGWNAGECCGQSQANNVDDVGFITAAIADIAKTHPIDPNRIFGAGHSNGAMMTYRMLCESDLYQGGVAYAGALEIDVTTCPKAKGKPILGLHGAQDKNVPVEGGHTDTGINSKTDYRSQQYTQDVFNRSGAAYTHILLPNAQHRPETINADLIKLYNTTLPQTIVSFLRLDQ